MKRPLSLVAFIAGAIIQTIYVFFALFLLTLFIDVLSTDGVDATGIVSLIVILAFELVFAIVSLIFNALSISSWNKSSEVYKKKRGIIITAIVLNFIFVVFMIVAFVIGVSTSALNIIVMVLLTIVDALAIIDLILENKRVKKIESIVDENSQE